MWFSKISSGFRVWFPVDVASELREGLVAGDFSVTVIDPDDSASVSPTVAESTQKSGVYYFDVSSAFLVANGPGEYFCLIQVDTIDGPSGPPEILNNFGSILRVTQEDFDSLVASIEANLSSNHGIGSWVDSGSVSASTIATAVWATVISSNSNKATEAGGMLNVLRKAVTNRQEAFSGSPGYLILFDDDGATPVVNQEIRDEATGGIVASVGVPAKRATDSLP